MIETDESVREALLTLDLERGATITEIRGQYLGKTSRDKFQQGVLVEEHLQKEFDKYHRAYVTLAKHLSEEDQTSDLQYYPSDQVFQFHFNQGVHYFIHRNYIKAGKKFQEAYKINNTSIPVLLYLGLLLLKRKNPYAAEKYFKEVVQLDQNNDDAWFYLGESYLNAGELRKALTMFETAKTLNPGRHEVAFRIKEIKNKLKVKSIKTKEPLVFKRFFRKLRQM
ncbi:MAG: tetratricopeptide repeat protein [Candidatus Aminicenantes bacterium]|jgi:tetratricopeptide (TPR) repeat protein